MPNGFGQYKWANQTSYQGEFKDGLKHGKGKWVRRLVNDHLGKRCNQYEGDYLMDRKHGWGKFEWESGNTYAGGYSNDEREGYGVMKWTDGSCYMGMWV